MLGKARAGADSDLLKHRFLGRPENPSWPSLPGGIRRWAEISLWRQFLPGNPAFFANFRKTPSAFAGPRASYSISPSTCFARKGEAGRCALKGDKEKGRLKSRPFSMR